MLENKWLQQVLTWLQLADILTYRNKKIPFKITQNLKRFYKLSLYRWENHIKDGMWGRLENNANIQYHLHQTLYNKIYNKTFIMGDYNTNIQLRFVGIEQMVTYKHNAAMCYWHLTFNIHFSQSVNIKALVKITK